jgi:hypothetical protein
VIVTTKEELSIKAGMVARAFRDLLMAKLADIYPNDSIRVEELKEIPEARFSFELLCDIRMAPTIVKTAYEIAKRLGVELSFVREDDPSPVDISIF